MFADQLIAFAHRIHLGALAWGTAEAILIYGGFTAVVFVLERRAGAGPDRYRTRNFINDIAYTLFYKGGFYQILFIAAATNLLAPYFPFLQRNLLGGVPWPVGLAIYWVVGDFVMYWWHRLQHSNRFLWAFHAVHHSQEHLTVLTTSRRHPLENFPVALIFFVGVLQWGLGVPTRGWMPAAAVITSLTTLQHAQLDWRLGPFYRVFVSPRFHAFHHSTELRHRDTNFGFLFSVWDFLFGTAMDEAQRPTRFGLDDAGYRESIWHQCLAPFHAIWHSRRSSGAAAQTKASDA